MKIKFLIFTSLLYLLLVGQLHAENFPLMIPYSGTISSEGELFEGAGDFKFAIVNKSCAFSDTPDQCITYWSNDGTSQKGSEPEKAIKLTVQGGRFQTKLGDTRFTSMTTIPTTVFDNDETFLRVWFNDGVIGFQQLDNDRQLVSAPYAYRALTADHVTIDNITSEQITDGTIGLNDIDSSQIQVRINGTGCSEGSAIRKIDQDGSIVCAKDEGVQYKSGTGIAIVENEIHILQESIGLSHLQFDPVTQEEMDQSAGVGISIQDHKISIAENGITQAHLNFDPATQVELDSVKTKVDTVQEANVPVGGVIDWWRPDENFNVPKGFKVCDGSVITEENSPYFNKSTPNLIGRFTYGVTKSNIGKSGGNSQHNHSTDIDHLHGKITSTATGNHNHSTNIAHGHAASSYNAGTHNHSVDVGHDHGAFNISGGGHDHVALSWSSTTKQWYDGKGSVITNWTNGEDTAGSGYYSIGRDENSNDPSFTARTDTTQHSHSVNVPNISLTRTSSATGNHNHGISVSALGTTNRTSTSTGDHSHDTTIEALGTTNINSTTTAHLPPYVGMLKIMRIY